MPESIMTTVKDKIAKFVEVYGCSPNTVFLGDAEYFRLRRTNVLSLANPVSELKLEGLKIVKANGVSVKVGLIL